MVGSFQFPLSGSQSLHQVLAIHASIHTFNSLSRDHFVPTFVGSRLTAKKLSIPSLGITLRHSFSRCLTHVYFQFPLSGSLGDNVEQVFEKLKLSIPSLGITKLNPFDGTPQILNLSIPSLGITNRRISCRCIRVIYKLSIPSLGITQTCSRDC